MVEGALEIADRGRLESVDWIQMAAVGWMKVGEAVVGWMGSRDVVDECMG